MGMLQIIDDESVLFDFDDPSGAANPHGLKTRIDDLDIGEIESEESTFAPGRAGLRIGSRTPRQATMSWVMRVDPYASVDKAIAGVRALGRLLEAGGVMLYQPDGVTQRKFIDYLPASSSPLIRGQPRGLRKILHLLQDPDGADFEVRRQPFLRGDELDSAVNKLKDPWLTQDQSAPTGTPDDWTWDSTTNITNQSIDADLNAFRFDIATTGVRMLQQTTAAASFAAGNVASFYFYGWVSAGSDVRVRCRIEYLNNVNTVLATHDGVLTVLGTDVPDFSDLTQAVSLTAPAAPANTDRVRVSMRFENSAATSRTVWLSLAQAEKTGAPSLWVPGEQAVPNDPASSGGRIFAMGHVHGDAPTPATFRSRQPASPAVQNVMVGRLSSRAIAEYINTRKILQAELPLGFGTNTTAVNDAAGSFGSSNSASETTFASSNDLTVWRLEWQIGSLLASLHAPFEVWARLRSTTTSATFDIRLDQKALHQSYEEIGLAKEVFQSTLFRDIRLARFAGLHDEDPSMFWLRLRAMRTAGTGNMRIDFLAFVPTEHLGVASWSAGFWEDILVSDPENDGVYVEDSSGLGHTALIGSTRGMTPVELRPGPQALYVVASDGNDSDGYLPNTDRTMAPLVSLRYPPLYHQ